MAVVQRRGRGKLTTTRTWRSQREIIEVTGAEEHYIGQDHDPMWMPDFQPTGWCGTVGAASSSTSAPAAPPEVQLAGDATYFAELEDAKRPGPEAGGLLGDAVWTPQEELPRRHDPCSHEGRSVAEDRRVDQELMLDEKMRTTS